MLLFPDQPGLRPTPDRVRETLFNWLGQTLHGRTCLDLFAGSGALGFEAASRGAARVDLVERNRQVCRALEINRDKLEAGNVFVHGEDGLEFAARDRRSYDVIFLDPPFAAGYLPDLLLQLPPRLNDGGVVYAESGADLTLPAGWRTRKSGRAGQVHYQLVELDQ